MDLIETFDESRQAGTIDIKRRINFRRRLQV